MLVIVLGLPMTTAIGTSLVIVALNSAAGFARHRRHHLDVPVAVASRPPCRRGVAPDGGHPHGHARLRRWFAYLVFAVAGAILLQIARQLLA